MNPDPKIFRTPCHPRNKNKPTKNFSHQRKNDRVSAKRIGSSLRQNGVAKKNNKNIPRKPHHNRNPNKVKFTPRSLNTNHGPASGPVNLNNEFNHYEDFNMFRDIMFDFPPETHQNSMVRSHPPKFYNENDYPIYYYNPVPFNEHDYTDYNHYDYNDYNDYDAGYENYNFNFQDHANSLFEQDRHEELVTFETPPGMVWHDPIFDDSDHFDNEENFLEPRPMSIRDRLHEFDDFADEVEEMGEKIDEMKDHLEEPKESNETFEFIWNSIVSNPENREDEIIMEKQDLSESNDDIESPSKFCEYEKIESDDSSLPEFLEKSESENNNPGQKEITNTPTTTTTDSPKTSTEQWQNPYKTNDLYFHESDFKIHGNEINPDTREFHHSDRGMSKPQFRSPLYKKFTGHDADDRKNLSVDEQKETFDLVNKYEKGMKAIPNDLFQAPRYAFMLGRIAERRIKTAYDEIIGEH